MGYLHLLSILKNRLSVMSKNECAMWTPSPWASRPPELHAITSTSGAIGFTICTCIVGLRYRFFRLIGSGA